MKDKSIKTNEQSNLENTIKKIKLNENEHFSIIKDAKHMYYGDKFQNRDEQIRFQISYESSKKHVKDHVEPLINSPYIGRIDYTNEKGQSDIAYIGTKQYSKGDVMIHHYASTLGEAYRNAKDYYLGHNISLNRDIKIKNSTVNHCIDKIYNGKLNPTQNDHATFQTLLKENRSDKQILTTVSIMQNKIIDLDEEKNVVIHGVPGSGKTAIGGYRLSAQAFKFSRKYDDFELLYITASNILKDATKKYLNDIDFKHSSVITFEDVINFRNENKTVVLYGEDNKLGFIDQPLAKYKDLTKKIKVTRYDGVESYRFRSEIEALNSEWSYHTEFVFDKKPNEKIVSNFLTYKKSKALFNILNDAKLLSQFHEALLASSLKMSKDEFIDLATNDLLGKKTLVLDKDDLDYLYYYMRLYYVAHEDNMFIINKKVKALFFDEAQDYTLADIKMLKKRYPEAAITLCGDINQSNGQDYVQENWDVFINELQAEFEMFNVCYRSSKRIVHMLNNRMETNTYGNTEEISNEEGEVRVFDDYNTFKKSVDHDYDNTCYIYMEDETKHYLNQRLKDTNAHIMHAYDVKGLEFDNVVVFDPERIKENKQGKKFFYMIVSRAIKNYYVVSSFKD